MITASGLRYSDASLNLELAEQQGTDVHVLEKLADCEWLDQGSNLLITGPTGTGKTYTACALGIAAVSRYKTTRYEKTSSLLRLLRNAEKSGDLTVLLNRYAKYDLLILDDFGLMELNIDMCRNLFELIDCRDGNKATVVVSQLPVSAWYRLFSENTYADACLDRLVK